MRSLRRRILLLSVGFVSLFASFISCVAQTPGAVAAGPMTIEQAVAEAVERSPVLRAQRAAVDEARGRLTTAATFPFNPELSYEAARRESPDGDDLDHSFRVSQEIEIGGQRGRRKTEASAELEAAAALLQRQERLLTAEVRTTFIIALQAREVLELERSNSELAGTLADVARRRFDAGAVPQMDVNLASIQLARAERALHLSEGAYRAARSVLAQTIGLDPAQPPELAGELAVPTIDATPLPDRLANALTHRDDLRSLRLAAEAARARIDRVQRERVPNLVLSGFSAHEEGTDRLIGGSATIAIPIFNRRQGPIAEATAANARASAEAGALELRVRQEVSSNLSRYESAIAAATSLQTQILGTLPENLDLLQRSFDAGKIGWTEVLIFRREFVDVQRDYIAAVTDAQLAAIEIDLASSGQASPPASEGSSR